MKGKLVKRITEYCGTINPNLRSEYSAKFRLLEKSIVYSKQRNRVAFILEKRITTEFWDGHSPTIKNGHARSNTVTVIDSAYHVINVWDLTGNQKWCTYLHKNVLFEQTLANHYDTFSRNKEYMIKEILNVSGFNNDIILVMENSDLLRFFTLDITKKTFMLNELNWEDVGLDLTKYDLEKAMSLGTSLGNKPIICSTIAPQTWDYYHFNLRFKTKKQ